MSEEKENQPTSCHKERLSVGESSVELNADGIKISENSILLDYNRKSERR